VRFGPEGRRIVTAVADGTVRIWDTRTGGTLGTLHHRAPVQLVEFSPDGERLATASGNRVELWNALTLEVIPPIHLVGAPVRELQFSGDGDRLAIAGADGTVRIAAIDPETWRWRPGSAEEAVRWSQLLAGRRISESGRMEFLKAGALRQLWQSLKAGTTEDFASADLSDWHRRAGERCEQEAWWFGARFHWDHALAAHPEDQALRPHRDRAVLELARTDSAGAQPPELPSPFPDRPAGINPRCLDFSKHFNATLTGQWLPTNVVISGNDLSALPRGVQRFNGVEFDVRGLIQLSGSALENSGGRFPAAVRALPVGLKSRRLHFLHGAAWSALAGTSIGSYVVQFANGDLREVPILFGRNIGEWWGPATQSTLTPAAAVAWEGDNAATRGLGLRLRIYQMTWLNPLPEEEIRAIDFKSAFDRPAPFLIAITAE